MDGDQGAQAPSTTTLAASVQAHIGRASRFADGRTRNWGLFFFFRILSDVDFKNGLGQLSAMAEATSTDTWHKAFVEFANSAVMNAGHLDQAMADQTILKEQKARRSKADKGGDRKTKKGEDKTGERPPDAPAQTFLDWLTVVSEGALKPLIKSLGEAMPGTPTPGGGLSAEEVLRHFQALSSLSQGEVVAALARELENPTSVPVTFLAILKSLPRILADPASFKALFGGFGRTAPEAGFEALSGGLLKVSLYELLRQMAPAQFTALDGTSWRPIMRSEDAEDEKPSPNLLTEAWDPVPINYAFTHSGLTALKLDAATLASFPDAFKDGMAARAERLGDTGPSAPENWHGPLGLKKVHGYFTGGFLAGDDAGQIEEKAWQELRDQVRAFNEWTVPLGLILRLLMSAMFRPLGMEILHIELGEDPYHVDEVERAKRLDYRKEHFGFQDGISQPFVDLKLRDTRPGGGSPRRNRTWAPVAPGEIYLDKPDEDGNLHQFPAHPLLRRGSTFLVFRKLEQDVAGFRIFLSKQRPRDKQAQERLASQFVGRWPNGTPLVLAPDAPLELGADEDGQINDFLYAASDPKGLGCPLGAHVRRTNPRDIGGTNDARHHRILRRSIAYGGRLLPEGTLGDGNKRGLLFIAANARIDLQFEVIQGDWINKGELLGQAGLGRCPILGANDGQPADAFLEAGAVAPVTDLPRFVFTRGGDYFFLPGVQTIQAIGRGCTFELPKGDLPFKGYSMGDTATPSLFSEDRLAEFVQRTLKGDPRVIHVTVPQPAADPGGVPVAFVGQFSDVKQVLSMRTRPNPCSKPQSEIINSVAPYHATVQRLSRGHDMLVSTEDGAPTQARREKMQRVLYAGWQALKAEVYPRIAQITKDSIEAALRRTGPSRRIDLVHDLASVAVYDVVTKIFGTPGPDYLTDLAVALPFGHQHIGEIQPEWLLAAQKGKPDQPGLATLQIWSILLLVDIVGNYEQREELRALSAQAGSDFLAYIDSLLGRVRSQRRPVPEANLLEAFVSLEGQFVTPTYTADEYYSDVRMLLLELVASAIANIPTTFGTVMDAVLKFGIPLVNLIPVLLKPPRYLGAGQAAGKDEGLDRLIYETCRINRQLGILMRTCEQDDRMPSPNPNGDKLRKGEWVGALVVGAHFDPRAFPKPQEFSLHPYLPAPPRNLDNYLLFGVKGGGRDCWGRDRLALFMLRECVKAAGRLQGLERVAGESGELRKLVLINVGLSARFASVLPDWPPPAGPAWLPPTMAVP